MGTLDFFVRAIDRGETSILTTLLRMDLSKFAHLIPKIERSTRLQDYQNAMAPEDRDVVIRKLEQRALCFDILVNHHFPHLESHDKPEGNRPVGIVAEVHDDGVIWAYRPITNQFPDRLTLDDRRAGNPWERWNAHGVRSLRSGSWQDPARRLPQHLAFEDVKSDLENCLQRHDGTRLWEWDTVPLVHERAWDLLYRTDVYSVRLHQMGRNMRGFYRVLGFPDEETVRNTPIRVLLERILYQMLWEVTQVRMMRRTGEGHFELPREALVTQEADRIWAERGFSLQDYNYRGDLPEKLIDLYQCLDRLAATREFLDSPPLPEYQHIHQVWARVPLDEVVEHARQMVPLVLESYRSMVEANFPTLAAGLPLYSKPPAFTVVQLSTGGGGLSAKYAFISAPSILNERFGSCYFHRYDGLLPDWSGYDLELRLPIEDIVYTGSANIYSADSYGRFTLQDHVYELIRQDLNYALRGMGVYFTT